MATKLRRVVTYLDGLLSMKSHDPWITWFCEITWQTKVLTSPPLQCWWLPNLAGWWAPAYKVAWPFDHVVLRDHVTNWNDYISTIRVPMPTKLGKIVTYLDGLLSMKLHGPLITWSCEIKWQTKTSMFPLPQCQWPRNLVVW